MILAWGVSTLALAMRPCAQGIDEGWTIWCKSAAIENALAGLRH